jgi:hypothetical protein
MRGNRLLALAGSALVVALAAPAFAQNAVEM